MTALIRPDLRVRSSWAEAMAEFAAVGEPVPHGSGFWDLEHLDVTGAGARAVVDHLRTQADPTVEVPVGRVHCSYFWITDGAGPREVFVGFLALRHSLTPWLLEEGGHIGYAVRPSRRREGHASRGLLLALAEAAALGLDRVLVTADEDNLGSQQVILGAGGLLEDTRNGKRRYWISTSVDPSP
ncbi:MAG: GNAT family N-acetyltransferase [Nocardioides sp.]